MHTTVVKGHNPRGTQGYKILLQVVDEVDALQKCQGGLQVYENYISPRDYLLYGALPPT